MKVFAQDSFFKSLKRTFGFGYRFRKLKGWFRYHFRKDFFRILKTALKGYPYDYGYLLDLERAKLTEMANYLERSALVEGYERKVEQIRTCIRLIDIINENGELTYDYEGHMNFIPCKDNPELYEMDNSSLKYICKINVNFRNFDRFIKNKDLKDFYDNYPHEFYLIKARQLYHKLRANYEEGWWD